MGLDFVKVGLLSGGSMEDLHLIFVELWSSVSFYYVILLDLSNSKILIKSSWVVNSFRLDLGLNSKWRSLNCQIALYIQFRAYNFIRTYQLNYIIVNINTYLSVKMYSNIISLK